ncbi:MAG: peptide cleavage/export ABC transporter [Streptococcaceae bacterium]|jgi:ATP-binding cassette subfamily C protein/competence factor transporting protein|nr:peptide cleavage/export ABC transporter [Streptococcaceae bacterium]
MKFRKKYYTPQVDARDCGVAALSMILKYHGTSKSLASLRLLAGTTMEGTSALGVVKAATELGFEAKPIKADMSLFEMDGVPYPFIVNVIKEQKYPHYYVVLGTKGDTISIADPDISVKLTKISKFRFKSEWTGLAILLAPKPEYKPEKEKSISLMNFVPVLFRQKRLIVNILVASFLVTLINILGSFYLQSMIDTYIPEGLMNTLALVSVALIVTYMIQQVLAFAQNFLLNVLGQRLGIEVILSYIRHIFELPMSFFATRRTGEITSRFSDANSILNALASTVMSLFLDVTVLVLTGAVLVVQNVRLFLLILVSIPFYLVIILIFVKIFEKQNYDTMQSASIVNSSIIEDINGIETIKALASEETQYEKIDREFVDYLKKSFQLQKNQAIQTSLKTGVQLILNVGVLWVGAQLVMKQSISLGQLITFNALLTYFTNPLTNIINLQTTLQQARVANNRLNEVYLVESEFSEHNSEQILPHLVVKFENVDYRYGFGRSTLTDINLEIRENEKLTIVGMSGSGKTTLVKLLVNFFEATSGKVTIGGRDVQSIEKHQLRSLINYLPQQPYVFTGSVLDNLLLGARENLSQEDIMNACDLAEILADIEHMELGFQTQLSADATSISGGQKQRIALARALLTPAKILILDEATSNLDVLTEKKILNSLYHLDKTIIFIAHRLSVAERADRIVVIDQGKIIEKGSHSELLTAGGFYAGLYNV